MENSLLESKIQLYNSLNEERKRIGREIAVAKVNSFFKQNKKKLIRKTIAWLMPFVLTAIGGYYIITYIPTPEIIHKTKVITVEGKEKTHQEFLAKLADFESKGSYTIVNSFGYMGKYQIGRQALTEIGFGTISKEDFLSSPELQEIAMKML